MNGYRDFILFLLAILLALIIMSIIYQSTYYENSNKNHIVNKNLLFMKKN